MSSFPRTGVTLVELLIALTLLGIMAAVVGVAVPRTEAPSAADEISHAISNARRAAIDSGRSVTIILLVHGSLRAATALPDGSIVADTALEVERLTGGPDNPLTVRPVPVSHRWDPRPRGTPGRRSGIVLLEVIVALTILSIAGLSAMAVANQAAAAVRQAREADGETHRASGFLDAVALWPTDDLDRHLGDRNEGSWILTIDRPFPTLYTVILSTAPDTVGGRRLPRELLRTAIYRPEPVGAR